MSNQKSYRESHLNKGCDYHNNFMSLPHRAMIWRLEQKILDRILREFFPEKPLEYLDFACGTGRILEYMVPHVQNAVGVDASQSMLKVARSNIPDATIIEADMTRDDVLANRKFNLITAFRFFPNAEAGLRSEAMQVLAKHLNDNGYLVFNNHKNTGSTRNRLARLFGRRGYKGMSIAEAKALVAENGLEILKTYHLCVFPASEKHMLLPRFFLRHIEGMLNRIPVLCNFGENLVFVCKCTKVK